MGGVTQPDRSGGVQSLDRAFALLEHMADAGGAVALSELAARSGLPLTLATNAAVPIGHHPGTAFKDQCRSLPRTRDCLSGAGPSKRRQWPPR